MRILHFYKTFSPLQHGGVENFIRHLASGAANSGHDVTILSLGSKSFEKKVGNYTFIQIKQDFVLASTPFSWRVISWFRRLSKGADVVHFHFPWPYMDLVNWLVKSEVPYIVTYHSDIVKQASLSKIYAPLMHCFLGRASRIVATSENYVHSSPCLQKYQNKTHIIPIGLDEHEYPRSEVQAGAKLKKKYGEFFFLFVGVLRYYKGLKYLLEAAKLVDASVVIVGEGPVGKQLQKFAGVSDINNVHFLGAVSEQDKVDLLSACGCVVLPSHLRSEAFGISLVEATMFGKPMICCEIGTGTSFINIHGLTGLTVEPGNYVALAETMNLLLANSELAEKFGLAARDRFESLFNSKTMICEYNKIYSQIIADGSD